MKHTIYDESVYEMKYLHQQGTNKQDKEKVPGIEVDLNLKGTVTRDQKWKFQH